VDEEGWVSHEGIPTNCSNIFSLLWKLMRCFDSSVRNPHQQLFHDPLIDPSRLTLDLDSVRADMPFLMAAHAAIKASLERARTDKAVGSSLQSSVILVLDADIADPKRLEQSTKREDIAAAALLRYADELEAMFVVSSVEINGQVPSDPAWIYKQEFDMAGAKVTANILPPKQAKCSRCWRYVAEQEAEDALCKRCEDVVGRL
jgi:isoleucyl-tRNA synthetase